MKVILDSNVLISAFASKGLCDEIFEYCAENHRVVLSGHLIEEVRKAFLKKLKMPKSEAQKVLDFICDVGEIEVPAVVPKDSCRDANDLPVLGLAVSAKADFIITGDADLLELELFKGAKILTPRHFWEMVKGTGKSKKQ